MWKIRIETTKKKKYETIALLCIILYKARHQSDACRKEKIFR